MATIKIIQRTKALSNGLYPIFLRVTKDRKSKFISLNLSCEKSQWNETRSEFRKSYPNFKQRNHSLIEVEKHIQEKGHLPNIPSYKEIEKEGINLGEMDSKLLEKIEELTLYSIKQNKQIKSQAEEIKELRKQSEELQELKHQVQQLISTKK